MAVYYIDPHTTTNGTGTWASPWSFAGSSRTNLVAGDEIRIKGVALTSLLTATVYTATWNSASTPTQVTITAGGGLGADFAAGSIIYLPDYDLFVKLNSVSGNNLITSNINFPIPDSTVTTITIRKVDTTTYPASTTTSVGYLANTNNLTITDGWVDATTRVTDGTVKTIIHSPATGTFTLNLFQLSSYGHSVSLLNTFISGGSASNGGLSLYLLASNSTISIGQIQGATGSGFASTSINTAIANTTIYVKNSNLVNLVNNNNYLCGSNITMTIDNVYVVNMANFFIPAGTYKNANNFTLNIGNMYVTSGNTLISIYQVKDFTVNFNGLIDQAANIALSRIVSTGQGLLKIKFGASFQYMYNKKVTTQNAIVNLLSSIYTSVLTNPVIIPEIDIPPGWTLSGTTVASAIDIYSGANMQQSRKIAFTHNVVFPNNIYTFGATPVIQLGTNTNILFSYRDNSSPPTECLNIGGPVIQGPVSVTNAPQVNYDNTVYRTSAPSIKSYLATKTTSYWQTATGAGALQKYRASKPIKIPVTSGVSYTVTGYIKTDDTAYVDGDCFVSIVIADTDIVSQNMTTACINAWEQFTLTFTSTITGEAHLCWNMFYENGAKSYWLDDLTIS